MEGIIVSWLALIDNIHRVKEERVPLTTIQKNNIARSLSDLVLVVSAAAMANAIIDKDKRTKADDTAALVLRRSTDDLLTLYNLATNPKFLWTPVSLEWAGKVMNLTFKGVMQMDPDKLIKATPIANQLDRYWNIMFNEDFEISTE